MTEILTIKSLFVIEPVQNKAEQIIQRDSPDCLKSAKWYNAEVRWICRMLLESNSLLRFISPAYVASLMIETWSISSMLGNRSSYCLRVFHALARHLKFEKSCSNSYEPGYLAQEVNIPHVQLFPVEKAILVKGQCSSWMLQILCLTHVPLRTPEGILQLWSYLKYGRVSRSCAWRRVQSEGNVWERKSLKCLSCFLIAPLMP